MTKRLAGGRRLRPILAGLGLLLGGLLVGAPCRAGEGSLPAAQVSPAAAGPTSVKTTPKKTAPRAGSRPGAQAAGAAEFDRHMALVWMALGDVKTAASYAERVHKDSDGYRDELVLGTLRAAHEAFVRERGALGGGPGAPRRRMAEEMKHSAALVDRYVGLVGRAFAAAQAAGSWRGEPDGLLEQAQAVLPGVDWSDETWNRLIQSPSFVEALPLEDRVGLGLVQDPAGIDLGAQAPHLDPTLVLTVREGSLADDFGLEPGDRLLSVDDNPLASLWGFQKMLTERAGQKIALATERKGKTRTRKVRVPGSLPVAGAAGR